MLGQVLNAEWYSEALGRPTQISALLPHSLLEDGFSLGKKLKTVYLLPGALSASNALFSEMDLATPFTSRTLEDVAIISVTPTFSFYTDYKTDYRFAHQYYTYVTQELIDITRTLFPLSDAREDTAIYGCSMGGWGAYHCGLNNPDIFGYIGAQSGMLDMQWAVDNRPFMTVKHKRQFGDSLQIEGTPYDLYAITSQMDAQAAAGKSTPPKLFQSWGGEADYLNVPNVHMHEHLSGLKHLNYTCFPLDCPHGWGLHNEGVNLFLRWFLSGDEKGGTA